MVTGMLTCPAGVVIRTVPESLAMLRNAVFTLTVSEPVNGVLAESQLWPEAVDHERLEICSGAPFSVIVGVCVVTPEPAETLKARVLGLATKPLEPVPPLVTIRVTVN